MSLGMKKRAWIAAGCIAGIIAAAGAYLQWQTSRALKLSRQEVQQEHSIAFELRAYRPPVTAAFEIVRSPQVFQQAARFQNHLYVAGPSGLAEYDASGTLLREFSAGRELPGSPLVALQVGVLADSRAPELIVATADEGILLFDGQNFRQIYADDPGVRGVTAILPVSAGRLLIGTKKRGVLVFDGKTIEELHPTLARMYVTTLAGNEVDLWVGTLEQGVKHWHAGTTETFAEEQGLPDSQVQAIAVAEDKAYVGTPLGVAEFVGGQLSRVLGEGLLVTSLYANDQELLIGSQDQGVVRVPLQGRKHIAVPVGAENLAEVRQFLAIDDGVVILTRSSVYETNAHGFGWKEVLKQRSAVLTDRDVSALAADEHGQVWVGYFNRGLDILPSGPGRARHVETDHVFCVNRIWPEAKGGTVEVATANGLVRFDASGAQERVLTKADGLIADHVTDVVPYRDGLAIATPAGITFLDAEGARSMYSFHGLVNNHVYALGVSGDDLLAGTLGGLSSMEKGIVLANYTAGRSGLKQNWITAVARVDDEWMIGTYGGGVVALDGDGKFHNFEIASEPMEINPNAMLVTARHVFAGTLGDGLLVYDRGNRRWKRVKDGLPSGNVTALAESNGTVFVGTDNGLTRIEEKNLQP